jgi:hypothetical protein
VIRKADQEKCSRIELFSTVFAREGGQEHGLGDPLKETVTAALKALKVNPASVIVWRDGISQAAFRQTANEEIGAIRQGLQSDAVVGASKSIAKDVPIAYIICQKRIATKFLVDSGRQGAPAGTLVSSLQGLDGYQTFYINGRAPPGSTPKPVRFTVVQRDAGLNNVPLAELTWGQCHNYPNWTGSIKVPSQCQMAHKYAELAGAFVDGGSSIKTASFTNQPHFL